MSLVLGFQNRGALLSGQKSPNKRSAGFVALCAPLLRRRRVQGDLYRSPWTRLRRAARNGTHNTTTAQAPVSLAYRLSPRVNAGRSARGSGPWGQAGLSSGGVGFYRVSLFAARRGFSEATAAGLMAACSSITGTDTPPPPCRRQ